MDLSAHIQDLITVANEMKNAAGVDKKWINKTIARLEEAQLFATKIIVAGSLASMPEAQSTTPCACVTGAIAASCPIHNKPV